MPAETQERVRVEPLVLVDTTDLPRDDWLNYRRRGIGGSDVAAILGVSPFRTARDIKEALAEGGRGPRIAWMQGHVFPL